jgi:hypothetical protein
MTVIKIDNFAGVAPRYSARLLPNNGAVAAENCKLLSGELRGLHETQLLHDFTQDGLANPVARAYRLPTTVGAPLPISPSDTWVPFFDPEVDFVRTPVIEDSFERYYWTGDSFVLSGVPQYNTRARINAADSPYKLGVPTPINAVSISPPSGTDSVRVYVYTFVSAYGEEGPPSPPTTATGTSGSWTITGFDTSISDGADRNITTKRIYRTVTGAVSTEFYFVADISLATTSFSDTADDTSVSANNVMPSLTWTQPPTDLLGLCAHPGGFLVGFSGRDLWISEPYQPHAWPLQYVQTMQTEIVGVAIYTDVIVVTTTSHPYIAEGMSPLNLTFQKIDSIDPCLNRRSMATTLNGVYYTSPQGIIAATGGITELATMNLFTREEWQNQFSPTTVQAVPYGLQLIAFDTSDAGFIFSPMDQNAPLTTLDRFSNVVAIQIDSYSGDVYLIQGDQARLWDPPASVPFSYTWTSKEFDLPNPVNFGAMRIKFNATPISVNPDQLADYTTFNNGRILKPLNCFNLAVINGVRTETVPGYSQPQIRNPLGGSPLFPLSQYTSGAAAVQLDVYARNKNSQWINRFSKSITTEGTYRMPTGFKSDVWQVRLIGNTNVYNIVLAETAKELKKV